jgi:hypothetical protein
MTGDHDVSRSRAGLSNDKHASTSAARGGPRDDEALER